MSKPLEKSMDQQNEGSNLALLAFHHSPTPMAICSIESGTVLEINASMCALVCYERNEIIDRSVLQLGIWHDVNQRNEIIKRLAEGAELTKGEILLCRKDGELLEALVSAKIIDDGNRRLLLWQFYETSERKKMDSLAGDLPGVSLTSEEQLRRVEAILQRQYQSFPIPTYTWQFVEDDFILIDFNEAAVNITQGKVNNYRFIHSSVFYKDAPSINQSIRQSFHERTTLQDELQYWFRTINELRWLKVTYVYVGPDLVMVHTEDISERKQAMEALKEQELRLQLITDNMLDLIIVTDGTSKITYASPSHKRILGYDPDELVGKSAAWFAHPDDLNNIIQSFRSAVEDSHIFKIEFRLRHTEGHYVWLEAFGTPLYNDSGTAIGLIFSSRDITRRKETEDHLYASELKFRQMAENIHEVFWLSDPIKHEMIYTSPAYAELWGVSREDLYQQHSSFLEVVHPDDRAYVRQLVHEELSHPITFEYRVLHSDGTHRWLRDRAFPLKDEDGLTYRIAGITEDITDLKVTELALRDQATFENLILRLSLELIDTKPNQLNAVLENALEQVGRQIRADQAFLFSYNRAGKNYEKLAGWIRDASNVPLHVHSIPQGHEQFLAQDKFNKETQYYRDIETMPYTSVKEGLQRLGIKSLLHLPVNSSNYFNGVLGFTTQTGYAEWQGSTLSLISLFGSIVANTVARRSAELSLYESYQDLEAKVLERTAEISQINSHLESEIEQRIRIEGKLREEYNFISAIFNTTNVLIFALDRHDRVVIFNHRCEALTGCAYSDVYGRSIFELGLFPNEELDVLKEKYEVYKNGNEAGQWYAENTWKGQDGLWHSIGWSGARVKGLDETKYFSVFLGIDLTENNLLKKKLRQSEDRFHRLFLDLPISTVEVTMKDNQAVIVNANLRAREIYGAAVAADENFLLENIFAPGSRTDMQAVLNPGFAGKRKVIESYHVRVNGQSFPVRIHVGQDPDPDSAQFILVIEDMTIEKARRSEEIAISEERQRIAREIHDGIAQDLASLRMRTNYWKSILKNAPEKLTAEFDFLQQQLGDNIQEVRRSIFALRPLALQNGNFFNVITRYCREFGEMNGLGAHVSLPAELPDLRSDLELTTFRILQESLNNIAKHAHAENVWITLEVTDHNQFSLLIQDDGDGFDPSDVLLDQHSEHIGLQQMKTRVQGMHGTFKLTSSPAEGTVIQVLMPLEID